MNKRLCQRTRFFGLASTKFLFNFLFLFLFFFFDHEHERPLYLNCAWNITKQVIPLPSLKTFNITICVGLIMLCPWRPLPLCAVYVHKICRVKEKAVIAFKVTVLFFSYFFSPLSDVIPSWRAPTSTPNHYHSDTAWLHVRSLRGCTGRSFSASLYCRCTVMQRLIKNLFSWDFHKSGMQSRRLCCLRFWSSAVAVCSTSLSVSLFLVLCLFHSFSESHQSRSVFFLCSLD